MCSARSISTVFPTFVETEPTAPQQPPPGKGESKDIPDISKYHNKNKYKQKQKQISGPGIWARLVFSRSLGQVLNAKLTQPSKPAAPLAGCNLDLASAHLY